VTVVLDSGIWISALHFGGTPRVALEKALTEDRVAICDQIEEEVMEVLWRKFGWEISRIEESLGMYLQDVIRVAVAGTLHGACRDAKDDMVVECAVNARASLIVSGDKDLLTLGSHQGVRVVTARDYIAGLHSTGP
jgi:putative PIN family toxin of toxin-antitoxin system